MIQPMRITEVIKPVRITHPKPGMYLVDMGQAFYGTVRLKVSGPEGTKIQMRSAYSLNPDGTLKVIDNRSARSTDVYILNGLGKETWSPRFRGQAYRYVEVTGFPGVPKADHFEGLVIHTDFETHGEFECSNPLINRIFNNVRWTQRSYIKSLPLDPDRDERQGWLGTLAKDMEGIAYNFNMAPVSAKWTDDLRFDQLTDGHLPDSSPAYWWLYRKSIVWPSNMLLTPGVQYDFYADRRVIERNYDAMKKWMTFVSQHLKPDFTTDQNRYGDWVDASTMEENCKDSSQPKWIIDHGETVRPLLTTAYYYNNCKTMARFASILDKEADRAYFEDLAANIKKGFHVRFFDPETNRYGNGTQTSYVLPLAFGMVDNDKREAVAANLVKDIMITHKEHLSVGNVGMMWLMQTLTDVGYPEVAYALATQTTKPSWGYMVGKGATTVWERWDSDTAGPGMNSEGLLILAGNVEAWFYQTLTGINHDPRQPGFKHSILRPCPVGDLTYAKATYTSMYGKIVSDWEIVDGTFKWKVIIPPNTTATVHVPGKNATEGQRPAAEAEGVTFLHVEKDTAVFRVESGTYAFRSVVK
jgi:alpha-L-rhamnosidase